MTKGKKHKKKKNGPKDKGDADVGKLNNVSSVEHVEQQDFETEDQEQEPGTLLSLAEAPFKMRDHTTKLSQETNGNSQPNGTLGSSSAHAVKAAPGEPEAAEDHPSAELPSLSPSSVIQQGIADSGSEDTEARLDALVKEREALRDEVAQLRKSLEELQGRHEEELGDVKNQLEDTQSEKNHSETQYRNLLGKVNTIKSQLGERLKADAVGFKTN